MSKPEDQNPANDAPKVDDTDKSEVKAGSSEVESSEVEGSKKGENDSKINAEESAQEGTEEGAEEGAEAEETIESLQLKLEQATEELSKFKDIALRAEAEMQNVRRRATIDLENAHKYGLEKFVQNILPVADGLEKAMESAESAANDDASKAISEGVGICQKMLADVLKKEGLEMVDPAGEPFDPNLHQAMSMVENAEVEPNSVVAVIQKGYTLNGRLVRPAMVMVSKAKPGDTPKIDETA